MKIAKDNEAVIKSECLAVKLSLDAQSSNDTAREVEVEGEKVMLTITKT